MEALKSGGSLSRTAPLCVGAPTACSDANLKR
jgi:hypothetical protein